MLKKLTHPRIFTALLLLAFLALIYIYLYPGSEALFAGRTDTVLSDGSDPASLPYAYDHLIETWKEHPLRFFYGSVYIDSVDPEHGTPSWQPWNERFLVLLNSVFFPVEQLTTAVVFALFLLNGLCMYLLCSYLQWSKAASAALSMAWAISCYTRARAKVHMALVGIYHLPLIFLGLLLVARGKSWRSLVAAALAFLAAGTVAHHYLITCVFISPVFLLFLFLQPEFLRAKRRIGGRMAIAVTPLILFLGWNFFVPVPAGAKISAAEAKSPAYSAEVEWQTNLLFLHTYYARAIDYLGGDIALQRHGDDLNPLRAMVNDSIVNDLGQGNAHERTNGIRWSVLLLALIGSGWVLARKSAASSSDRRLVLYFLLFALLGLWLSLSPDFPLPNWGASYLIFTIFPKIRVASRAGIQVHFALLMIVGVFLHAPCKSAWRKVLLWPGALAALFLLDYPPIQEMPMAQMAPVYQSLLRQHGECGLGMAFPFFSPYFAMNVMYNFTQKMRGSDCPILNAMSNLERTRWLTNHFPPNDEFLRSLSSRPQVADQLEKIVKCVPLNWIAFHPATPAPWAADFCRRLGWTMNPDLSCIAPNKNRSLQKYPESCGL